MMGQLEKGFTLIELMIVISIIGILATIAIPQYDAYRKRSYNSGALWDIKNGGTAQESYYVDSLSYASDTGALSDYGLSSTEGVVLSLSSDGDGYTFVAYHSSGDRTYTLTGPGGSLTKN